VGEINLFKEEEQGMSVSRFLAAAMIAGCAVFYAGAAQDSAATGAPEAPFQTVKAGKFTFVWKVVGPNLSARVSYPTKGWVAAGFNPTSMMKNANIIMGAAVGGKTVSSDEFGVSDVSHKPDTAIGGKNNILSADCTQANGITTFAFTIPLDSGDPWDVKLTVGAKVKVILAAGPSADFKEHHLDVAKTTIILR
jgi:hypothetical protein